MGTKMALAFANVFIENQQILRQSCIEFNRTLVTKGFFSRVAGCFGVGCGPTDLWPKAEVFRGEAAIKMRGKKLFAWVTIYKDITEPETSPKKSPAGI